MKEPTLDHISDLNATLFVGADELGHADFFSRDEIPSVTGDLCDANRRDYESCGRKEQHQGVSGSLHELLLQVLVGTSTERLGVSGKLIRFVDYSAWTVGLASNEVRLWEKTSTQYATLLLKRFGSADALMGGLKRNLLIGWGLIAPTPAKLSAPSLTRPLRFLCGLQRSSSAQFPI